MKKVISMVLVACLALSMMVMSVSAAESTENYSRGEWIKELAEAAGADVTDATMPEGKGVDVKADDEYFKYIAWGYTEGIIKGYNEEGFPFKGDKDIEIQQAMAMVTRAIEADILPAVPVSTDASYTDGMNETFINEGVAAACAMYALTGEGVEWSAAIPKAQADVVEELLNVAAGKVESPSATENTKFSMTLRAGAETGNGYVRFTVYETYAVVIEMSKQQEWLSNSLTFGGAIINIDVDGSKCGYNVRPVVETEDYVNIAFVPEKTREVHAAWMTLMDSVAVATDEAAVNGIFVSNNSEVAIGQENLVFKSEAEGLKMNDFSDLAALKVLIRDNVQLGGGYEGETGIGILVGADTQVTLDKTVATLEKDCLVWVNGMDMSESTVLSDLFADENTSSVVENLVKLIDELVGAADGQTVNVSVGVAPAVAE